MAINEENDLIGYDPLAWMANDSVINENVADDKRSNNKKQEKSLLINEESNADDNYYDLIEDAEENAVMEEDGSIKDDVAFENDNVLMEDVSNDITDSAASEEAVSEEAVSEDETDLNIAHLEPAYTEGAQIDLDAVLSIQHVVKLYEKLKNALATYDEIEINASDVSSIDTSTLQLLVSLKKDAVKLQKKVTIIYPSPRFVESAKLLGLLGVLEVYDV